MSPLLRAADRTFGSLRVRNFKLFISGQLVSVAGTWMQTIALGWLILELTDSGFAVGIQLALQFSPILVFGLWGGLLADRFDKRTILILTQTAMALVATSLWAVTISGSPELWVVYALVLMQGLVTAVDNPTRQSFVTEMVGRDLVANAVGLNSAVFNACRIIGPAIAGVVIATIGLPWAFLINAVSFGAVIFGLRAMDADALYREPFAVRRRGQLRAGLRYVWGVRSLRYTVLLVAVFSTFALNFTVTLPLFARFTFDRGAGAYGLLTSLLALGALIGALISAARRKPTKWLLIGSAGSFGVLALTASFVTSYPIFAALLVPIGASSITFISTANAILQLRSDPAMRGRVMALHGLVFLGSTPFGGPLVGWISQMWGPPAGLALGGAAATVAAAAAFFVLKRSAIEDRLRVIVPLRRMASDRSGSLNERAV